MNFPSTPAPVPPQNIPQQPANFPQPQQPVTPSGFVPPQPAANIPTPAAPVQNAPQPQAPVPLNHSFDGARVGTEEITEEELAKEREQIKRRAKLPDYVKMILVQGDNYLRLVGKYKKIRIHWISGDDGIARPYLCDDKCIICELINPFLSYVLVDTISPTGKKGYRRKYAFEDIVPALSKKITGDSSMGIQGWAAKDRFLFNCIDRMDNWCVENKHTKILSYSEKSIGIGSGTAEQIWALSQEYGPYNRYDIKITRSGVSRSTSYTVMPRHNGMFELSEEEKQYVLYDLDKIVDMFTKSQAILDDAPNQIKEILQFLAQQGSVNTSPQLLELAQKFQIPVQSQTIISAPIVNQQLTQAAGVDSGQAAAQGPQGANAPQDANVASNVPQSPPSAPTNVAQNQTSTPAAQICPHCGTPRKGNELQCSYCGSVFKQ